MQTATMEKTKFHKNKVPGAIWEGVKNGVRLSVSGWAKRLDCPVHTINTAISLMRKRGYHVHPVGGSIGFGADATPGVLVDIMENKKNFSEVFTRQKNRQLFPALRGLTRKVETASVLLPEVMEFLEAECRDVFSLIGKDARVTMGQLTAPKKK